MRDNYNACTPFNRKFIIVMGTDDYGWAVYDIDAPSVLVAKDMAERRELRRRRLVELERKDGYVQNLLEMRKRPRSDKT